MRVKVDLGAGEAIGNAAKGRAAGRGRELPRKENCMEVGGPWRAHDVGEE